MDPKLLASAFVSVFFAELGDKTQIAAFSLAAGSSSRLSVFLGASAALVVATALAVLFAEAIGRFVDPAWLRRGAGVVFIVLGCLYLFTKPSEDAPSAPPTAEPADPQPDEPPHDEAA